MSPHRAGAGAEGYKESQVITSDQMGSNEIVMQGCSEE